MGQEAVGIVLVVGDAALLAVQEYLLVDGVRHLVRPVVVPRAPKRGVGQEVDVLVGPRYVVRHGRSALAVGDEAPGDVGEVLEVGVLGELLARGAFPLHDRPARVVLGEDVVEADDADGVDPLDPHDGGHGGHIARRGDEDVVQALLVRGPVRVVERGAHLVVAGRS